MNHLVAGDIVVLKSGGPSMTIGNVYTSAGGAEMAACSWFDAMKLMNGTFPLTSLAKE